MSGRPVVVGPSDSALLAAIRASHSVVAASARVGIPRDRAVYRLARLARAFGGPVVAGRRGGAGRGGSALTPLGERIVGGAFDGLEVGAGRPPVRPPEGNRLAGRYATGPPPTVDVGGGLRLRVAFGAADGERVALRLDPEAVVVARVRFPASARNVLPGRVERVRRGPDGASVLVRTGPLRLRIAVTEEPIRELGLAPGARVWLYVKATALRRVGGPAPPTRGSPRP